ncbi:MAG: LssY C-terminal domain-containing protein [Deltaproteobacteria bacterium]|nr:LssY C-terminal domain-containing protein [Deltaproteobacteria bacterium]
MPSALRPRWTVLTIICCLLFLFGCASSFNPKPLDEVPFMERAQTKQDGGVRVTAAVLTSQECVAKFGANLYRRNIQPVWLEIENKTDDPLRFLPLGLDPAYFTPLESAYLSRFAIRKSDHDKMDNYYYEHGMGYYITPGNKISGFVYTSLDEGTKAFNVDIISEDKDLWNFTFFIPVPGIKVDHHDVDWDNLYAQDEIIEHDEAGLREALENLPCCTTNKKGTGQGDPLNIVVIGDLADVYYAFIRAGWDETETIYRASILKTVRSFLFGGRYRYSPISALYVFGRPQDAAFQRARSSIHERNHLRLWLAPMRFEGKYVWIGQISRDIGVRFTTKTITTHKIDPDVDETRNFLIQDLWYSQGLKTFGFVKGVGAAPYSEPRGNLTGDPYFTDGNRAVLWVSSQPAAFSEVGWLDWEVPPER